MTKAEVQRLVAPAAPQAAPVVPAPAQVAPVASATDPSRPVLPAGVPEFFLPVETPRATVAYSPALFGFARLHFVNAKAGVDVWEDVALMAPLTDTPGSPWDSATSLEDGRPDLEKDPAPGARFAPLPGAASNAKSYATWQKGLADYLYRTRTLTLYRSASLKLISNPGETDGEFRARAQQALRERRDAELDRLRKKYAPKLAQLQDQERRAVERVEREKSQFQAQSVQTAISVGASVIGALFGRKVASVGNIGRATTAARGFGRAARERQDIGGAEEALEAIRERKAQIEADIQADLDAASGPIGPDAVDVEEVAVRPRKSDITAQPPVLVWVPA